MKIGTKLTGRIRYRPNYWGTKFILQVEEVVSEASGMVLGLPPMMSTNAKWRDARISDFDLLQIKQPEANEPQV